MFLILNYQEQGEIKAKYPATDIRYRGVFDKDVTITVDTITVDTVTMDPMTCMDIGANNSGIVGDSLFDTIEKIEQDIGTSDLFVPDVDLSLDGLMGAMEDTNSAHNMELSMAEVIVEANSAMSEKSEVKCESNEGVDNKSGSPGKCDGSCRIVCGGSCRMGALWYFTNAQGTLLDLHGHPNGPLNGPCKADFRGPLVKKGPPGSFHGPNWSFFLT